MKKDKLFFIFLLFAITFFLIASIFFYSIKFQKEIGIIFGIYLTYSSFLIFLLSYFFHYFLKKIKNCRTKTYLTFIFYLVIALLLTPVIIFPALAGFLLVDDKLCF